MTFNDLVPFYKNKYFANKNGEIYRKTKTRFKKIKPSISKGYYIFVINDAPIKITKRVHHAILEAFVGPRPLGLICNHKDGDKLNNKLNNLEYCTHKYNRHHAIINGLAPAKPNQKLKKKEILLIKKMRKQGYTLEAISKKFNVTLANIGYLCEGILDKYKQGKIGNKRYEQI